jgi:class 3 adenylate cyclase
MARPGDIAVGRLQTLAEHLDDQGLAAELLDDRWQLVWVSKELLRIYGERIESIGLGEHVLVSRSKKVRDAVTPESRERWLRANGPFLLEAAAGDRSKLADMTDDESMAGILEDCEPCPAPPFWASTADFSRGEFFGRLNYLAARLHETNGDHLGFLFLYGLDVPSSIAMLLMRGNREMHERMAAIVQPGQRSAAVLCADLQASGSLSRGLATSVYFRLIQQLRTAIEAAVDDRGGIVGKHAGDGVTAYFLSEQLGSASRAARAGIETARMLPPYARDAASRLANEGLPVDPDDCELKVALHWGPSLYIGQVASRGRLEITALGDEMNEAARIEQSASGGMVLASKPLLERLDTDDAAALDLDPTRLAYRAVGDIEGVGEKAIRDAGTLAVADIP